LECKGKKDEISGEAYKTMLLFDLGLLLFLNFFLFPVHLGNETASRNNLKMHVMQMIWNTADYINVAVKNF
jgi:hypothetical protein